MKRLAHATLLGDFSNNLKIYNNILQGTHNSGMTILQAIKHEFYPQGLTVAILLAESHVTIHTYPESSKAYIDVFTCGNIAPEEVIRCISAEIGSKSILLKIEERI